MAITLSVISLVVSIAVLIYSVKLTLVYHRFNESIKLWAQSIDDTMRLAIDQASMNILEELDGRISKENEEENNNNNNNIEQNE